MRSALGPGAIAAAGAGLAVAGAAIQGLLRNPLGDPFVLGIASGAGVGVRAGLARVYPIGAVSRGLKGEEILLEARIVAVADAVEAMLSPRPHRPALTLTACVDELQSQAGRRYDARVVKACVKLLRDGQVTAVPIDQEGEAAVGQRIA